MRVRSTTTALCNPLSVRAPNSCLTSKDSAKAPAGTAFIHAHVTAQLDAKVVRFFPPTPPPPRNPAAPKAAAPKVAAPAAAPAAARKHAATAAASAAARKPAARKHAATVAAPAVARKQADGLSTVGKHSVPKSALASGLAS
jgi:hypothetical protein